MAVTIPSEVSGNIVPSSGWNAIRDAVQASGWAVPASGFALNTVYQNSGLTKAIFMADVGLSTNKIQGDSHVEFLTDAGSPPTIVRAQIESSDNGGGSTSSSGTHHLAVPINPNDYFKMNVVTSGNGVSLQRSFLYVW